MSNTSAALLTAKTMDAGRFLSPNRFAAIVASITPRATGNREADPSAMTRPVATPAAGQKTGTPFDGVVKARLRRAAKKYATDTAATPSETCKNARDPKNGTRF
jgi:hypothetical protein